MRARAATRQHRGMTDTAADADERMASERIGRVLGEWTLERLIGVGGMAAVYAARGKDGALRLSTVKPTALVAALGAPGLEGAAREVEEALAGILEDAAR